MVYPDNLDLDGVELFVIFGWKQIRLCNDEVSCTLAT
jgi:hypothetical protein